MPKLSPRAIAHDAARDRTYLLAKHGKDTHLLALDPESMTLASIRTFKAPSETFWIGELAGQPCAVFWAIGKTMVVPLADPAAKARTLKLPGDGTFEHLAAFAPPPIPVLAVHARRIYRFDGDRWTDVDTDPTLPAVTVAVPTVRGTFARALGGEAKPWIPLVESQVTRACVAIAASPEPRLLVGSHGGRNQVVGLDGSALPVDLQTIWCAVGHERGFFAWSNYRVWEVGLDGATRDTEITRDLDAADTCLFRAGSWILFVQGTTIHRYHEGAWTAHDMAAAGGAIGLA
jgi:hypothetical protein